MVEMLDFLLNVILLSDKLTKFSFHASDNNDMIKTDKATQQLPW